MKIVLFLGAGFSAAYNFPVMNNFFSATDSNNRLNNEDRIFINNLILESRKANSFLQSSPTNLEDILSFAIMADRLSLSDDGNNSRNYKIRSILQKIFTQITDVKNYWPNFDKFEKFLSFMPDNYNKYDLSIITTNYDVNIESALYRLNFPTDPGFDFIEDNNLKKNISITGNFYSKQGLKVFKLHGSVNWFEYDDKNTFSVEGRIAKIVSSFDDNLPRSLPLVCTGDYINSKPPVIIPPSFLKPDLQGPLNKILKGAAEKLSEANLLIFVGYSFPETDTEMMYFLARSLTDNAKLRKIVIIDPQASTIYEKLSSTDSKFGSHFKDLLEYKENYWEKTNIKKYIN